MTYRAKVIAGGKIVTRADLCRELRIKEGDTPVVQRDGDEGLSITTFAWLVRAAQRRVRTIMGPGYSVDQFLQQRRADWGEG